MYLLSDVEVYWFVKHFRVVLLEVIHTALQVIAFTADSLSRLGAAQLERVSVLSTMF